MRPRLSRDRNLELTFELLNCCVTFFFFFFQVVFLFFDFRDAEEGQPNRSKKELIDLAKEIAAASKEVSAYSAKIAKNCPDKRVSQVGIGGGVGGDERSSHLSNREGGVFQTVLVKSGFS